MKKIFYSLLAFVIAAIMVISPMSVIASASLGYSEFEALSLLPSGLDESDLLSPVTRAEFAYMASRLITRDEILQADTRFSDVSKEDEYSGYIEFIAQLGIINGVSETEFMPNGSLSAIMAYKMLVKVLGFDSLANDMGGYPDGYIKVCDYLKLSTGISSFNDTLTLKDACLLCYKAMTEEYPASVYAEKNGESVQYLGDGTFSLMTRLKLSSYTGVIKKISDNNKSVVFEVSKNDYSTNYVMRSKGEEINLELKNGMDAYRLKNIPVSVFVGENDKVLSITENKRYEVIYAYIEAVNGVEDKEASVAASTIKTITLSEYEDEFDASEELSLSLAGVDTSKQAKIIGSFAKVVLKDGEVYHIDAWRVNEGGIITEVGADGITYTYQNSMVRKLRNLDDYKNTYVYINGIRTDLNQLKKNSVFDYYSDGNVLMIACSEKVISDVFYSINDKNIEIGGMYYYYDTLYYEVADKYKKYVKGASGDMFNLLGNDVSAYFGPDGLVRFIAKTKEVDTGEFYGVVLGANPETLSDEAEIKILAIYPFNEEGVYKITDKTSYEGGLSLDILEAGAYKDGDFAGDSGVYVFEKNSKNEIVKVSNPEYVKGFGEGVIMKTGITKIPNAYVSLDNKPFFFSESPIIAVYQYGESLASKQVDYNSIYERLVENATLVFFGKEISDDPEFVMLCGDLRKLGDKSITRGIVIGKGDTLNENKELAAEVKILVKGGGIDSYILSYEDAEELPLHSLVSFHKGQMFSDMPIYVYSDRTKDLKESAEKWDGLTDGKTQGLQKGVVTAITNSRLCVENNGVVTVSCMHPTRCMIAEVDDNHPTARFKAIETSDIEVGDTVYYDLAAEGIETIIAVR